MLIGLMTWLCTLYYWTWFIWPFVFVFSLGLGIADHAKNENASGGGLIWAAISLLIILAGVTGPAFM